MTPRKKLRVATLGEGKTITSEEAQKLLQVGLYGDVVMVMAMAMTMTMTMMMMMGWRCLPPLAQEHRLEKLPLVDEDDNIKGLITSKGREGSRWWCGVVLDSVIIACWACLASAFVRVRW